MSKKIQAKAKNTTSYITVIRGGAIKTGIACVIPSDKHPEIIQEEHKKYYGDDIKSEFVVCHTKSIDLITSELNDNDVLSENKLSQLLYNISLTEIKPILKNICDASKFTKMNKTIKKKDIDADEADADDDCAAVLFCALF